MKVSLLTPQGVGRKAQFLLSSVVGKGHRNLGIREGRGEC